MNSFKDIIREEGGRCRNWTILWVRDQWLQVPDLALEGGEEINICHRGLYGDKIC